MVLNNAPVYYPPEDATGWPISRGSGITVPSRDGMQPNGYPVMVIRTPHAVVPDPGSGGAFLPELWDQKFLPDGRLVPATALGSGVLDNPPGRFMLFTAFGAIIGAGASHWSGGRAMKGAAVGAAFSAVGYLIAAAVPR